MADPTEKLVEGYLADIAQDWAFTAVDNALNQLFLTFPKNSDLQEVLLKVVAINGMYNTNIYDTLSVAQNIVSHQIDERLEANDIGLVEDIATVTIQSKKRRNYSFATKYCSFQKPDVFPIYDSIVDLMLWEYSQRYRFAVFKRYELQDYAFFSDTIAKFRAHYRLNRFSLKEIDKFLWKYGKDFMSASANDSINRAAHKT